MFLRLPLFCLIYKSLLVLAEFPSKALPQYMRIHRLFRSFFSYFPHWNSYCPSAMLYICHFPFFFFFVSYSHQTFLSLSLFFPYYSASFLFVKKQQIFHYCIIYMLRNSFYSIIWWIAHSYESLLMISLPQLKGKLARTEREGRNTARMRGSTKSQLLHFAYQWIVHKNLA